MDQRSLMKNDICWVEKLLCVQVHHIIKYFFPFSQKSFVSIFIWHSSFDGVEYVWCQMETIVFLWRYKSNTYLYLYKIVHHLENKGFQKIMITKNKFLFLNEKKKFVTLKTNFKSQILTAQFTKVDFFAKNLSNFASLPW